MMWNEKRHYSPPLPVESACDHVTCNRMLGVLYGRWWKMIPPNTAAAAASSVSNFRDEDAGLKTRLLVAVQTFRLHRTLAGNVPCLSL